MDESWTLDELQHHFGEAYEITGWQAKRRDGKGEPITADDADTLAEAIRRDYAADPVPRDLA